ncbi:MAG: DNA gyrase inhibitor YacG [Nevskia sp.]|nr:DNA gyrase inhibitor YacG [Nevskia sp.]
MEAPLTAACPRCSAKARLDAQNPWRPFCSERCKLIDLGNWLEGRYTLPAEEAPAPVSDSNKH